jgi:hypothetical protein
MSKNRIPGPLMSSQAHTSLLATHRLESLGSYASVVAPSRIVRLDKTSSLSASA